MDDLFDLDLVAVADLIRRREISSFEVTSAVLARIEALDPLVNAFIAVDAARALAAARAADEMLARGEICSPLHGVPLAHKDTFYRTGEPATGATALRADWRAPHDATVLKRLDAAGAICLGRLNMAEFAYDPTGDNRFCGPARNPWHVDHICGGSSSGSGAAVAARLCFGSLGTDTGGSVRLPAAICGLVGVKPTHGRVSLHGCMPLSPSLDTIGPLAQTARDAARLLAAVAGPDPHDPTTRPYRVDDYEAACEADCRGLRIGLPENYFWDNVTPDRAALFDTAIDGLRRLGCAIHPVLLPDLTAAVAAANIILGAESVALHRPLFTACADDYSLAVRTRLENGLGYSAVEYIDALRYRGPALAAFAASLQDVDLLAAPTLGVPTPRIDAAAARAASVVTEDVALLTYWTRPINFLGVPAVSVPVGLDAAGLPVGLQLIGRPFDEAILLRAAAAVERVVGFSMLRPSAGRWAASCQRPETVIC